MTLFELAVLLSLDRTQFNQDLEKAKTDAEQSGEETSTSITKSVSNATRAASTAIAPLSAVAMNFGKQITSTGMSFEATMSKVQAISGASADELDALKEHGLEVAKTSIFTSQDVANAYTYMGMAGWKTEAMLGGLEGIINLASAAGQDLATTSDIVTDAITAFGLSAEDSSKFADMLAATATNSNTNVALMGETFKYVAPLAGVTFKNALGGAEQAARDTALATGLMANAGIKGSQGGTSLKNVISKLIKPTKDSAKAMDALGLSIDDGQGNMLSLREIMDQMRSAFAGVEIDTEGYAAGVEELNRQLENGEKTEDEYAESIEALADRYLKAADAQKGMYAAQLAGAYGLSGLLAIVSATDEDYQKLADAVDNASQSMAMLEDGSVVPLSQALEEGKTVVQEFDGAANAMAGTMLNNTAGGAAMLESSLDVLKVQLSQFITPMVGQLTSALSGLVSWFASLDSETQQTVVTIGMVVAAAAPALRIISAVSSGIGGLVSIFGVLKGAATALWGVLAANPIGAVIAVVAALAAGITYLWNTNEDFRAAVITIWEGIKSAITTAWEAIKAAWDVATGFFSDIATGIKNAFEAFPEVLSGFFSSAWENIKNIWSSVGEFFSGVKETIVNTFTDLPGKMIEIGKDLLSGLGNGIVDGAVGVIENAKKVAGDVLGAIKGFFGISSPSKVMRQIGKWMDDGWALGIEDGIQNVTGAMKTAGELVLDVAKASSDNYAKLFDPFSEQGFINAVRKSGANLAEEYIYGADDYIDENGNWVPLGERKKTYLDDDKALKALFSDHDWSRFQSAEEIANMLMGGYDFSQSNASKVANALWDSFNNPTFTGASDYGSGLFTAGDVESALSSPGTFAVSGSSRSYSSSGSVSASAASSPRIEQMLQEIINYLQTIGVYIDKNILIGQIAPGLNSEFASMYTHEKREAVYV